MAKKVKIFCQKSSKKKSKQNFQKKYFFGKNFQLFIFLDLFRKVSIKSDKIFSKKLIKHPLKSEKINTLRSPNS